MEYTSGGSTWGAALRRLKIALVPGDRKRSAWSVLVPLVALTAGLLFTASARTAQGTELRDDRTPQLTTLIDDRNRQVAATEQRGAVLRAKVQAQTNRLAASEPGIAALQNRGNAEQMAAGLVEVEGRGITVTLNDAPRRADGGLPAGAQPDDVVVHQQDVQAVANALWAGGAEAMTIMDVRVISTSAVRCVGNTLLLQGRVYSPPFVITAIGDPAAMRLALNSSQYVSIFRQDADAWGLGYHVQDEGNVKLPAYNGSTSLQYAQVPQ